MTPREYLENAESITDRIGDYDEFILQYEKLRENFGIKESVDFALIVLYGKDSPNVITRKLNEQSN